MRFVLTIICCILLSICSFIVRKLYIIPLKNKKIYCITFLVGILVLITTFNIHINLDFTIFTIPNLLLFIIAILIPWDISEDDFGPDVKIPLCIVGFVAFWTYMFTFMLYVDNLKISEANVIEKTTTEIDTININGNYFYAAYDACGYKYSIINENNEPELTSSPEDVTKVHYISENEKAHLEKTVEISYKCYKGDINNHHWDNYVVVSYILYIPEGSIAL